MIERLSQRLHFAVFGPNLGFDDGFPATSDETFLRQHVSSGKTLAGFRVPLPLHGYFDEQREYETRLARYLPDGGRDRAFGNNGQLVLGAGNPDVKVVAGSRILVSGNTDSQEPSIRSYTLGGRPDMTFGDDGVAATPGLVASDGTVLKPSAALVAVQPDGKLLLQSSVNLGGSDYKPVVYLTRLNTDGSLDTTFGKKGYITIRPIREASTSGSRRLPCSSISTTAT